METVNYYAFNERATEDQKRVDIIENPREFLERALSSAFNFGTVNIMQSGIYREMAWAYNLRPFLKKYVYRQHGSWHEAYALNRANLRKLTYGKIEKILEDKN